MKRAAVALVFLVVALLGARVMSQQSAGRGGQPAPPAQPMRIEKAKDGLYFIRGPWNTARNDDLLHEPGDVAIRVASDGLIVVDDRCSSAGSRRGRSTSAADTPTATRSSTFPICGPRPIADSANGTITRTYDGFDRLSEEVTPQGTVDYTYDAAGRRASMTVAGQTSVTYTYDNANRLIIIGNIVGGLFH